MYVKAFQSLLDSSVWAESSDTRVVWMTLLLMSNQDGMVLAAASGIANRARVDVNICLQSLQKFTEPDPDSKTADFEGRRIERVDGGYYILNYTKYREMKDENQRRAYMREYMATRRAGGCKQPVSTGKHELTQAEAEAEAKKEKTPPVPPIPPKTPKPPRSPKAPSDPRVKPLGDRISEIYTKRHNGLPLSGQVQMRAEVKKLLKTRTLEDIERAYTFYMDEEDRFYRDHAWGKFTAWWAAHVPKVRGGA